MIIQIARHGEDKFALFPSEDEMADPAFFSQISHILLGNHPHSDLLLQPVGLGTDFSKAKATHYIYICFYSLPKNLVSWVGSIQQHLPPNYWVVGGLDPVTAFLAKPQIGTLTLISVACAKK